MPLRSPSSAGAGLVNLDPALPAHDKKAAPHEGVQHRRERVWVQVDGPGDLGPGPATWGSLHERDDLIHFGDMLTPFSVTALDPKLKIYHVHFQYVCTTHMLCGATTDRIDFPK